MAQLLVRNLDSGLVEKLKERARRNGVSSEEEHRRILTRELNRLEGKKPTLGEFLISGVVEFDENVELDLERPKEIEERDIGF